jgi:hypothetical protein
MPPRNIAATLIRASGELVVVMHNDTAPPVIRLLSNGQGYLVGSPHHPVWDVEMEFEDFELLVLTSMVSQSDGTARQAALYLERPQES